ncbi:MAG: HD-GYP domain-containing protein [Caulobacteraceae bacterium]
MRFVEVTKCKNGDILAEDLFNKYGAIIVAKYTVLNSYIICKLNELGIQQVRIFDDKEKSGYLDESRKYKRAKKTYAGCISDIRSVVSDLAAGRPLDADKIIDISDRLCCEIRDSYVILKVLNEEKNFDEYTYTHSLNVAFYAMLAGKWLNLDADSIRTVIKAGLLHDIGKMKIPAEILNKKARLSEEEFEEIKKHTLYGYSMVKDTDRFSEEICQAVLLHHERIDKSGYPLGIGCEEIDIFSKILAVADVYDAMTSDRVYKKRDTPFRAFEMFKTEGVNGFDPLIVNVFLNNVSVCYVGSKVFLNTGETGEIAYIPPQSITDPVVRIGQEYIDLAHDSSRNILCMV